jgi:hypothetical protein
MKNNTKILLSALELEAILATHWAGYIEKSLYNDPDWGFIGSGDHYVVYFNVEFSSTQLVSMGREIQQAINH